MQEILITSPFYLLIVKNYFLHGWYIYSRVTFIQESRVIEWGFIIIIIIVFLRKTNDSAFASTKPQTLYYCTTLCLCLSLYNVTILTQT